MEKYRYKNGGECVIEIEAPIKTAQKFIDDYYPNFKLIDNDIQKRDRKT